MSLNKQYDIICLTLTRWDAPISSASLSLSKELAKTHRVFYIDHPYSWKDYFKQRNTPAVQSRKQALLKGKSLYKNPAALPPNLTVVTPRLTLPINFLPPGNIYNWLSRLNDKTIINTIRNVIKDHNIKDFVFVNFFDPYFARKLPADIKPFRTIYQCMDDISQVSYTAKHGLRLEEEIIGNFDYTLCTSKELKRLKSPFSLNVHFHPNAADIAVFKRVATDDLPVPPELAGITKKVIGFTGNIEYRSDFLLLKKIAEVHTDKILFLVGPVCTNEHIETGLSKMPNVVFAGHRKITELPNYLNRFDCVIIPYRKTVVTKSIYPLKINEYLAAGKPVISTHFSEDIYSFKDVAYIADTHEEFIQLIDKAIAENNTSKQQERIRVAEGNTWGVRVKQFWEIIMKEPVKKESPKMLEF